MAAITFRADIRGLRELDNALKELPKDLAKRALANATRAGAAVLAKAAQAAAPIRRDGKLKKLRPTLTRAQSRNIARRIGRAGGGAVKLTRGEMRTLAPEGAAAGPTRGPGYLKRNIKVYGVRLTREGVMTARVGIGAAFYGGFLEAGTRKMGPRPWFRAAIDGAREAAIRALGERLKVEIERAAQKYAAGGR